MDVIKERLQVEAQVGAKVVYGSTLGAIRGIIAHEGTSGFGCAIVV